MNPLLIKELREEVRSRKIFFLVPVYIAILSTVAIVAVSGSSGLGFNPVTLASTSRFTLFSFVITITILIGLICSVFGAASFTTEREKATYELLELTPLSYTDLVLGKFLHALMICLLILLSSLPVLSTLFFMGGVTYLDIFLTLFYLIFFFMVIILGAICISIVTARTIFSIILALGLGFTLSTVLGVLSGGTFRQPELLGFAVISPWLVAWQQIFSPTPLRLFGMAVPVWPFYLIVYSLLTLLLLCWARNALDVRKLERNPWTRILGLICVNVYVAVSILCLRSYRSMNASDAEDFFQVVLFLVIATLPFFASGVLTERDTSRFERQPLLDSFDLKRLFLNYPPTGLPFLFLLTASLALNLCFASGLRWNLISPFLSQIALWIAPWLLLLLSLRLWAFRGRVIFVTYLLGTLLCTLMSVFWHTRGTTPSSSQTIFSFYLTPPNVILLSVAGLGSYSIARIQARRRRSAAEHA
jgi:hypothetical protein